MVLELDRLGLQLFTKRVMLKVFASSDLTLRGSRWSMNSSFVLYTKWGRECGDSYAGLGKRVIRGLLIICCFVSRVFSTLFSNI
jgi:hypothetical protein